MCNVLALFFFDGSLPKGLPPHLSSTLVVVAELLAALFSSLVTGEAILKSIRAARSIRSVRNGVRTRFNDNAITIQASGDTTTPKAAGPLPEGTGGGNAAHRRESEANDKASTGYLTFKVACVLVGSLLVLVLAIYAWLHRTDLLADPERILKVCIETLVMFAGILADILFSFSASGRSLRSLKVEEVLTPLAASFIVFYALWSRLVATESLLTACYNAFTSGLTWRRLLLLVRERR